VSLVLTLSNRVVNSIYMGGMPQEQKMLKENLPGVIETMKKNQIVAVNSHYYNLIMKYVTR